MKHSPYCPRPIADIVQRNSSDKKEKVISPRLKEFREKLRENEGPLPPSDNPKHIRATTPIVKLDQDFVHPNAEKEPLEEWPDATNPFTGEIGGPKGPEPTRFGDWERKGRVTDF